MAREILVRCDAAFTARVKDCGESHEDTRTFTITTDGETWEIDLGGPHAAALLEIAHHGRQMTTDKPGSLKGLNRRVRNLPNGE